MSKTLINGTYTWNNTIASMGSTTQTFDITFLIDFGGGTTQEFTKMRSTIDLFQYHRNNTYTSVYNRDTNTWSHDYWQTIIVETTQLIDDVLYDYIINNSNYIEVNEFTRITLYRNSAESNKLDKTSSLTEVSYVLGRIEPQRDNGSLIDMNIVFEYNQIPNFNYLYIDSFQRYYFVTDISLIANKLYSCSLHEDVLMSHRTTILTLNPLISRTSDSNKWDYDLIDEQMIAEADVEVFRQEIDNNSGIDSRIVKTKTIGGREIKLSNAVFIATKGA